MQYIKFLIYLLHLYMDVLSAVRRESLKLVNMYNMQDLLSDMDGLNVSWRELSAWLCNETFIRQYRWNITCPIVESDNIGFNNTGGAVVVSPAVLKMVIMAGIIFLFGITFNVCLLVTLNSEKRFHKPSWKYVTNLAVADILCMISMAGFVLYILATPANWSNSLHSYLFPSLDIFLSSASMLSVATVALDRVYAIMLLQKHNSSSVIGNPRLVIGIIWGYSIVVFTLALCRVVLKHIRVYNDFVFWLATGIAFFGAVIVTLTCYVIIVFYYIKYSCTWWLNWRMCSLTPQLLQKDDLRNDIEIVSEQKLMQSRLAKILLTAVTPLPFIMGWSFFLGTQTYEVITKTYITDLHYNIAMIVVPWIVSALNPLIYMLISPSIRKKIGTSLRRFFGFYIEASKTSHISESVRLTEV